MDKLSNNYDSIIFDLDGTLWDSTANVAHAWQAAAQKVGFIKEEITQATVRSITGMAYDAIFEKLFPYLSAAQRLEFKTLAAQYEIDKLAKNGGSLYDGVTGTLQYLKARYRLFIVSNCQSGYIETFFEMDNVAEFFEGHQCYGTKGQPKWQNIADVINDFKLQNPVYVGDTMGDYDSAIKAGVPFIFAAYGFGVVAQDQVATIKQFGELKNIL